MVPITRGDRFVNKKIAVVTGAGSGIGRAIAIDLAKQNYHVVLINRNVRALNTVANKIKSYRKSAEIMLADVSDEKQVKSAIKEIILKHKKIDVLVNNAGVFYEGTTKIKSDELNEMIQTNLLGAIYVANVVAKQMKKQKSGYIINISSYAGKRSFSNLGGYSALKFGLVGFNDALHKELLPYHVKASAICPSIVNTPMTRDFDMPNKIKIQPRDIVKTVNYLLSLDFNSAIKDIDINCAEIVLESE